MAMAKAATRFNLDERKADTMNKPPLRVAWLAGISMVVALAGCGDNETSGPAEATGGTGGERVDGSSGSGGDSGADAGGSGGVAGSQTGGAGGTAGNAGEGASGSSGSGGSAGNAGASGGGGVAGSAGATPELKYPPDTTLSVVPIPDQTRPGYLESYDDPTFGTKVTRITDSAIFGDSDNITRHNYAKTQVWNSDESLMMIRDGRKLLDGTTYEIKGEYSASGEVRWANTDPLAMYVANYNGSKLQKITVVPGTPYTATTSELKDFSAECEAVNLGPWEGNISDDDEYAALACKSGSQMIVIVWNLQTNVEVSRRTLSVGWDTVDWVSISPSGEYVVAVINGVGTKVWNRDLTGEALLTDSTGHADMGYDIQGREVIVKWTWEPHPVHQTINSFPLDGSTPTRQFEDEIYKDLNGDHVSMRANARPGWVYVSAHDGTSGGVQSEVFAVKLDGSEVVNRFVHHHASMTEYDRSAFGCPSRTGTRVIFASDFGDPSGEVNSYVAEFPQD